MAVMLGKLNHFESPRAAVLGMAFNIGRPYHSSSDDDHDFHKPPEDVGINAPVQFGPSSSGSKFGGFTAIRTPEPPMASTERRGMPPAQIPLPNQDEEAGSGDPPQHKRKRQKSHKRRDPELPAWPNSGSPATPYDAFAAALTEVIRTALPELDPDTGLAEVIDDLFNSFPAELIPGGAPFQAPIGGYQPWQGYRYS